MHNTTWTSKHHAEFFKKINESVLGKLSGERIDRP